MRSRFTLLGLLLVSLLGAGAGQAQVRRKIIIDQDCRGPATTDLLSTLALIQAPDTDVLGVTVVSGDQWRDEEVAHSLRLLEVIGRTDIPVVPGAVFPLINRKEEIARWEKLHGRVGYQGAWNEKPPGSYPGWWAQRGRRERGTHRPAPIIHWRSVSVATATPCTSRSFSPASVGPKSA